MSSINSLITSKVGRRFFLLFLITALVPVILLAAISYQQVSNQLYLQTKTSLHKESKSIGMGIHQRLNFLETEIGIQLQKRDTIEQLITYQFDDELGRQLKRKFKSLSWFDEQGHSTSISGNFEKDLVLELTKKLPEQSQFFQLMEHSDNYGRLHFFAIGIFTSKNNNKMYLLGEIDSNYLWRTDTLSEDESTCIFNEKFDMLFCSKVNGRGFVNAYKKHREKFQRGLFEWKNAGEVYISNSWEIFLGDHELVGNWTVVLSKSKQSVFRTIDSFRITFAIVMLLALILIILISIKQIRNVLTPLEMLKEGAKRLTTKDFSRKIVLNSNDEFDDLAHSFNDMSDELSKKFRDLEVISEINKVILTATEADVMCDSIIRHVSERINADAICVAIFDEFSDHEQLHLLEKISNKDVKKMSVNISLDEKARYLSSPDGMVVNPKHSHLLLAGIFEKLGMNSLYIFPIMVDAELAAVCVIAYQADFLTNKEVFEKAKSWVEKISMALSKSAWQEKLYHQAHYDSLTNLPNRIALKNFLHNSIHRAEQYDSKLAVLFIDLDRFKIINDSLGHLIGDKFLQIVSERINQCITSTDMVSRFGGDEFTIVLTNLGVGDEVQQNINKTALKILESIAIPVTLNEQDLFSTCSIGVVMYPDDATGIEDLLKNADSAMYHAKSLGGNTLQYYSESMNIAINQRLKIETDLRKALQNDELTIYFQPQVETKSLKLLGAEALVRWNHPELGIVSSMDFIPIAEKSNLICDVDLWVLDKTVKQIKIWESKNTITGLISVNFSTKLIQKDDVVGLVWKILSRNKLEASKLVIEITESALIQNFDKTIENMHALIKLGVSFAVDDFGTGYSSLSYLKSLPVDKLKIDQAFIFNLSTEKADASIVKNTIALAKDLGMLSLAEGVETDEHLQMLAEMGCNQIQGYLISKPLPAEEYFEKFLATSEQTSKIS